MENEDREPGLADELEERKVESRPGGIRYFIPNGAIDELLTPFKIRAALVSTHGKSMEGLDFYVAKIFECARKLFAILLLLNFEEKGWRFSICAFIDNGITDDDLPFHTFSVEGSRWQELCSGRSGCKGSGRHSPAPVLSKWKPAHRAWFYRDQWVVLAPVFLAREGEIPKFDFETNIILPFRNDYESNPEYCRWGGYSQVWPVRIVAEHQNVYKPNGNKNAEPLLAVKQLTSGDKEAFKKEEDMLHLITKVKHRHLIELLATYELNGKHHLLFPFAEANLRTFWEDIPIPNWNTDTYLWVIDQITGLASALMFIHEYDTNPASHGEHGKQGPVFSRFKTAGRQNVKVAKGEERYGRHGDIKPDNILWRADSKFADSHGILIITDLGLAEFRGENSKSRISPNNLGGSQTYIAPELALFKPVSRAFDIWGLGCVYLEFLTWLLNGSAGLEAFHELRMSPTEAEVEDDAYFTLISSPSGKEAVVRPAVVECMRSLRSSRKCSRMIGDLLDLVEDSMLLVDPVPRISAKELHSRLRSIHHGSKKANKSDSIAGASPRDEGKGFIAPKRSSL